MRADPAEISLKPPAEATGRGFVYETHTIGDQTIRVGIRPSSGATDRPPLLICNGIGANMELLGPLAAALDDRELIMFDAPGTGESSTPLLPYRVPGLARTILKLLDVVGRGGAVDVMGISWGGILAQTLALRHRSRVRKLILAATSPGTIMIPGRPSVLMKLISPRRYHDRQFMHDHAGEIYGGRFRSPNKEADRHEDTMLAPSVRGYIYQLLATWGWSSLPWLWLIRQPTLVLHGKDDPIVPVINARLMTALIPHAHLQEIDDGHLFMITSADETARYIDTFLDGGN